MKTLNEDIRDYLSPYEAHLTEKQREIIEAASRCRMPGIAFELIDMFSKPEAYAGMSFDQRIERCFERQLGVMSKARFARLYRNSNLPRKVYLREIAPRPERGITSELLLALSEMKYLETGTNIVFTGPVGVGKSTLAQAAATEAICHNHSVMYYRASELAMMLGAMNGADYLKFRDRLKSIKLLVLDDWGQQMLEDDVLLKLNEIAEARYRFCSTIVTAQVAREALGKVATPSTVLTALTDRLFRSSDIYVNITGSSLRGTPGEIRGER